MKEVEVLYFFPSSQETERKAGQKKKYRVRPGVYVYPLPQEIQTSTTLFSALRQKRVAQFITHTMSKHRVRRPLLWVTHPWYSQLVSHLSYHYMVYDCGFLWDESLFLRQEQLVAKADLVFAASESLKAGLRTYHRNVALLENGVNTPLFVDASPIPKSKEKLLGFAGAIDYDMDLAPLVYAAEQKPFWKFYVVGPCDQGNPFLKMLSLLPNVRIFGEQNYLKIPEFLMTCHVLMDFRYHHRPLTDVNSIRLYEYMATGRPIVASMWKDEIERYPDVVYSAYHEEDFLKQCEVALMEDPDFVFARRKSYGDNASWTKRADTVMKILTDGGIL